MNSKRESTRRTTTDSTTTRGDGVFCGFSSSSTSRRQCSKAHVQRFPGGSEKFFRWVLRAAPVPLRHHLPGSETRCRATLPQHKCGIPEILHWSKTKTRSKTLDPSLTSDSSFFDCGRGPAASARTTTPIHRTRPRLFKPKQSLMQQRARLELLWLEVEAIRH